jgi:hypothetical protein
MPFYNIFVDWDQPLSEMEQSYRLEWPIENALSGMDTLIIGTTNLSTKRSRVTFQVERPVGQADFEGLVVVGASHVVLSPVQLSDSGFPLLGVGSEAVEIGGLRK